MRRINGSPNTSLIKNNSIVTHNKSSSSRTQESCNNGLLPSLFISLSMLPVSINLNILRSQRNDQTGCPKLAGIFPSTKKWLYHANPYPNRGTRARNHRLIRIEHIKATMLAIIPMKCHRRVDGFECCIT